MEDDNKRNLQYFEAPSMRALYDQMETWQVEHKKRLLSVSIESDQGSFCCIALTNPTEVILVNGYDGYRPAKVILVNGYDGYGPAAEVSLGALRVSTK